MNVNELVNKLTDFDGDMEVVITDNSVDFIIMTVSDNGFDTVWLTAGESDND